MKKKIPKLKVNLLGHFELSIDGMTISDHDWPQRKTLQLFKILISQQGQSFTVDQLVDWLYPNMDPVKASRNLQKRVSELRRMLEPTLKASDSNFIVRHGSAYCFNIQVEIALDIAEFTSMVVKSKEYQARNQVNDALQSFYAAMKAYKHDLLLEDLYEDWSALLRVELRNLYLDCIEQAAICEMALENPHEVIHLTNIYISHSNIVERIYRLKMLAHYQLRDEQQIIQTFEVCKDVLEKELDAEVSQETTKLLHQMQNQELPLTTGKNTNRTTIAVLPFSLLNDDTSLRYFDEGIRLQMIHVFSKLDHFRVISKNSISIAMEKNLNLRDYLGADFSLEGSVQVVGNDLHIVIQISDLGDDSMLFSKIFRQPKDNPISIQEEVAKSVVEQLQIKLNPLDISTTPYIPSNTKAYHLYLQAEYFSRFKDYDYASKTVSYFEKAIDLDPRFALAYARLAFFLPDLIRHNYDHEHIYQQAKTNALKALSIDENLSAGYTALARVQREYEKDYRAAEDTIRKALKLNPNDAWAHRFYAILLFTWKQDIQGAFEHISISVELDPLNLRNLHSLSMVYGTISEWDNAMLSLEKCVELEPNATLHKVELAIYHAQKQDWDIANNLYISLLTDHPGSVEVAVTYANFLKRIGKEEEAQSMYKHSLELQAEDEPLHWRLGEWYLMNHQFENLIELGRRQVSVNPNADYGHLAIAMGNLFISKYDLAVEAFEHALIAHSSGVATHMRLQAQAGIGIVYAYMGNLESASHQLSILEDWPIQSQSQRISWMAALNLVLGNEETAFSLFKKAFEAHDRWMYLYYRHHPLLIGYTEDQRYLSILKRFGQPNP